MLGETTETSQLDDEDDVEDIGADREKNRSLRSADTQQYSDSEASGPAEDDEDLGGWGSSKRDYYNADVIETEADALEEEAEAIRLQKKHLEALTEADFGFDEVEWLDAGKGGGQDEDKEEDGVVKAVLPQLRITSTTGTVERMKILAARYPEFEPLAQEFLDLQAMHEDMDVAASTAESIQLSRKTTVNEFKSSKAMVPMASIARIKLNGLTAYLAALSMYFAIFTSASADTNEQVTAKPPTELRDHPIMETLIQCRELWEKVKDISVPELQENASKVNIHGQDHKTAEEQGATATNGANEELVDGGGTITKPTKRRKSKAQRVAESAIAESNARRAERVRKTEQELASLSVLKPAIRRSSKRAVEVSTGVQREVDDDSDFGEEMALTPHEAAEKAKRKKTLRFYTSQIAQKANKRDTAGRDAGGDADVPYRERLRDRQARLNAEAESRGKKRNDGKSDVLGGESDEEDRRAARDLRGENDGSEDGYYNLVTTRAQKKKADNQIRIAAQMQAELEGGVVIEQEQIGPDGKRAITYAIEKNKGLTPKRKKDVRNPRVKKRKKYEDKKKKLGSIRQVYKGGEGRGGYGGELTGIKKGLIRSVKL